MRQLRLAFALALAPLPLPFTSTYRRKRDAGGRHGPLSGKGSVLTSRASLSALCVSMSLLGCTLDSRPRPQHSAPSTANSPSRKEPDGDDAAEPSAPAEEGPD